MQHTNSHKEYERASKLMPGGVNSPVRAFKSVGGNPLFISKALGSKVWDVDGNEYIDYVGSWGPAILGHAHPKVIESVKKATEQGLSFGAPTVAESELAEKVMQMLPSIEMLRLVSSGTEACMSAIRVARGYTGRTKIIKFDGNYHGHSDQLLVKAGSGVATFALPDSAGIPEQAASDTIVLPYNDLDLLKQAFEKEGADIACVIIEPFVGNAGFIRPKDEFHRAIRSLCDSHHSVLIFDEVMTGFRVGRGCAQGVLGIKPDLTTLGKVIGGGMPLAAYGGKKEIMKSVAPLGAVYQAGTLSGNPVAVASGIATLELIDSDEFYADLGRKTEKFTAGLLEAAQSAGIAVKVGFEGGMFGLYFSDTEVLSFADAKKTQMELYKDYFWEMLNRGIYLAPSGYEAGFVSSAHSDEDIQKTINAAAEVFKKMKG